MIPALVLTAGLATRLRPLSFVRAKAALPVAGEPLARRILRWLASAGVTEAVLNLHHLPHTLTALVGDGADLGVRVRYSWESPVLGSAGGPRRAAPLFDAPRFLVANGDTLTDLRIDALVEAHAASGALVTLAVTPNTQPDKYGGVLLDDAGTLTGTVTRGSMQPSYHFLGVQVAEADAFRPVQDGVPAESISSLYPMLVRERPGSVRAHVTSASFLDIGTPGDYLRSSLRLAREEGRGPAVGTGVHVDPTARIVDSVLWDAVGVGAGAMLRECVVADGAQVPPDTSWHGVTLRPATGQPAPGERVVGGLAVASL